MEESQTVAHGFVSAVGAVKVARGGQLYMWVYDVNSVISHECCW